MTKSLDGEENNLTTKLIVLALVVFIYYMFDRKNIITLQRPIFVVTFIVALWGLGAYAIWYSRYFMPHVTINNFSGSILGRPVVVKDTQSNTEYLIFNTGEHLQPVYGRGKLATLVITKKGAHRAGRNYVGHHFGSKVPLSFLPPAVFNYLYRNKDLFNTENIVFGKFSEEFLRDNPDVPDYEHLVEKLNSQINERDKIIEKDNDTLIEMKKAAEEITGTKEAWYKGLLAPKQQKSLEE